MPVISTFHGVTVVLFYLDTTRHKMPHVHVIYKGRESVFSVSRGLLLEGSLASDKIKLIQSWIGIHKDELIVNWELAEKGKPLFKVKPLK
jgi:hypothetical protein